MGDGRIPSPSSTASRSSWAISCSTGLTGRRSRNAAEGIGGVFSPAAPEADARDRREDRFPLDDFRGLDDLRAPDLRGLSLPPLPLLAFPFFAAPAGVRPGRFDLPSPSAAPPEPLLAAPCSVLAFDDDLGWARPAELLLPEAPRPVPALSGDDAAPPIQGGRLRTLLPRKSPNSPRVGTVTSSVPLMIRAVSEGGVGGASSNWRAHPTNTSVAMTLRPSK